MEDSNRVLLIQLLEAGLKLLLGAGLILLLGAGLIQLLEAGLILRLNSCRGSADDLLACG